MTKATNLEISDGKRAPRTRQIHGLPSGCFGKAKRIARRLGRESFQSSIRALLLGFYARAFRLLRSWQGKRGPTLVYDLVNAGPRHRFLTAGSLVANCTIGLGYGMGAAKFLLTCEKMGIDLPPVPKDQWVLDRRVKFILLNHAHLDWRKPEDEERISRFLGADQVVAKWRQMNPQVQNLWKYFQSQLETSAANQMSTHTFVLPSGRKKTYYDPHFRTENKIITDPETGVSSTKVEKRLFASTTKGYPATALHGGPITENIVQATARDVMFWGAVDIIKARPNWHYVMNCYDEVVFEVPETETADAEKLIPDCLCRGSASSWTQGLPLEVDGGIRDRYEK